MSNMQNGMTGAVAGTTKKVIIIGAGVAGLVAAHELEKRGHLVEILEGSNRVGGRIYTHRFHSGPDAPLIELDAMRIPVKHRRTMQYVTRLGLADKVRTFSTLFSDADSYCTTTAGYTRVRDAAKTLTADFSRSLPDGRFSDDTIRFGAWLTAIGDAIAPSDFRDSLSGDLRLELLELIDQFDLSPFLRGSDRHQVGAGSLAVRVLPDDRRLDDIAQDDVTYDLVYREVLAFYELTGSFMRSEVFSLADRFAVRTYADLIWQMCDPRTRMKTYHMPPTRDLSAPKARLLLRFLRACRAVESVPTFVAAAGPARKAITSRGELVHALRDAVTLELAVMAQYLYAAFSIPTHAAGTEHVRHGRWSPRQLALACGDGGQTRDGGMRGSLLTVAREEMIHFLALNNILTAIGEPFHVPLIDFGAINHQLPIPLDLSLEPLGVGSVARFIAIEHPARLVEEVARRGPASTESDVDERYGSASELYADIREGLCRVPELFLTGRGRGGGEHHLFLRRSVNDVHPDYQLEVDDLASAQFALDVVTEQGEGNVLPATGPDTGEKSHFDTFRWMYECLTTEQLAGPPGRSAPWTPAYPALRNPTLIAGDAAKELVTDPVAAEVVLLFNRAYFMALQLMVQHFGEAPDASLRRSALMNRAIDVMTCVMRPLGELLTAMPSGRRGRTAGPSFELESVPGHVSRPDVARRGFALRLRHLAARARACLAVPADVTEALDFLADFFGPHTTNGE